MGNFLYDYQYEAVSNMSNGCILNGGVGSGKSRTGLYYYFKQCGGEIVTEYKDMASPKNLYIITTARKRDSLEWEGELSNYLLSTDNELCYYKDLTIVIDSWNNIGKYVGIKDAFFIFDEDRVIGSGAWVKAFLKITKVNEWIILSATPGDSWVDYIPVFIANGFYRNKTEFNAMHIIYSRFSKWPKIERYINEEELYRLRNKILIKMEFERHTRPHHETIWTSFDKQLYKKCRVDRYDYILDLPIENATSLCNCLRRVVNTDESKVVEILKIMEEKKKAIIFYNYNYELDLLKEVFSEVEGMVIGEWNGHCHQPLPLADKYVYLVQYTAGCEGWNCIDTDTIIFFSESYSYRTMEQAAGRIDRLNTPFVDLYYYHLKSHSDIDLAISKALSRKKDFNIRKFAEKNTFS